MDVEPKEDPLNRFPPREDEDGEYLRASTDDEDDEDNLAQQSW